MQPLDKPKAGLEVHAAYDEAGLHPRDCKLALQRLVFGEERCAPCVAFEMTCRECLVMLQALHSINTSAAECLQTHFCIFWLTLNSLGGCLGRVVWDQAVQLSMRMFAGRAIAIRYLHEAWLQACPSHAEPWARLEWCLGSSHG